MRLSLDRLRSGLPLCIATLLAVASLVAGYSLVGNGIGHAQTMGGPMGPPTGGAMGPMGPPVGGMGMGMGMGMGGGAAAAPAADPFGQLGTYPAAPPLQDYATNASSYSDEDQWEQLDERYEVSMEWARQIDAKWQPIRREELHYNLAALGLAIARPSSDWDVLHPNQIALQGKRVRERTVDAYIRAQRDLIPPEVMENLRESARLAVERKTRWGTPEAPAGQPAAPAAGGMGMPALPAGPAGAGAAQAALSPEDQAAFERRVAEELEYLICVYLAGNDSVPWYRTAYDPEDRKFDADGVPVYDKHEPPYYHSNSGAPARTAPSAGASAGGGGGRPGLPGVPGGGGGPGMSGMPGGGTGSPKTMSAAGPR